MGSRTARLRSAAIFVAALVFIGPQGSTRSALAQVRLPGGASEGSSEAGEARPTLDSLVAKREEVAEKLEALNDGTSDETADGSRLERLALLERLDRTLASHQEALERIQAIESAGSTMPSPLGGQPPYPFSVYEATSQALDLHLRQTELLEAQAQAHRSDIERLANQAEAAERERRRVKERAETASDPLARAQAAETLRRLELESQLAGAELARARSEVTVRAGELEAQVRNTELLEATLRKIRGRLSVTRLDLDGPINRISLLEERTRADAERARTQLTTAERRLADAQNRSDRLPAPTPELRVELQTRRAQRELAQTRIAAAEARLGRLALERQLWERRFAALRGAPRAELVKWSDEIQQELDRLRRSEQLQTTQREATSLEVARLRDSIGGGATPSTIWQREHLDAVMALRDVYATAAGDAADTRAFLQRTLRDFLPEAGRIDPVADIRRLIDRLLELWDREVFVVDDRSITLGKLVLASILFILAFSASRWLAEMLGRLVYRRAFEAGAAIAFQSLTFYALLVALLLLALRTVNIPLTAFALLGGALAIGLGFGSQNVIGNFIGGLILLVERPIKVGDVVDVEGVVGVIDRIGPRSTQIRTFDNLHIIVPNGMLLEQKVVNWTLSDDTVRRQITIGVSYDASVRDVTKLILRAIDEHGRVLRKPEPKVIFQDFGSDALVFRAFFWLQLATNTSLLEIESDLRHRILHLFRDAGITIAFPQRDLHIDTSQPLEVRMLPATRDGEG